jgi:hypothetical protein
VEYDPAMKAKSENAHALPSADIVGMPAEQLLDLLDRSLAENAERHAAPSSSGLLAVAEAAVAGLPPFSSASDGADDLLPELRIVDALLAGSDQLGSGRGDSAPEWNRPAPPPARLRRRGPHRPAPQTDRGVIVQVHPTIRSKCDRRKTGDIGDGGGIGFIYRAGAA